MGKHKERNKVIFISIVSIIALFFSCQRKSYVNTHFQTVVEDIEKYSNKSNLTDHLPEEFLSNDIGFFGGPDTNHNIAEVYVIRKLNSDDIENTVNNNNYIHHSKYSDTSNFFFDKTFIRSPQDYFVYENIKIIENQVPIPVFTIDFGLGMEEYLTTNDKYDKEIVWYKSVTPDDLHVYVIEAQSGNFWKNKTDTIRPSSLGNWKHGYSRGFAVSESMSIICYWLIMW